MKPSWPALALVFALYFAGVKLGLLTILPEGMAVFWPPNGVVLAALLRYGAPALPFLAPIVLAAEMASSVPAFPVGQAILFGTLNFSEAALAWFLLSRLRFDPGFGGLQDLWKFLFAAPFAAAFFAALGGAAIYVFLREGGGTYAQYAQVYWFGDGLGLLVVTPMVYGLFFSGGAAASRTAETPVPFGLRDLAVWSGAAAVLMFFMVFPARELVGTVLSPVLVLPAILFAAARYPQRWTAFVVVAIAYVVIVAMMHGRQPFGPLPERQAVLQAQEFILVLAIMGLGFSALLAQLRKQNAALEARVQERTAKLLEANRRLAVQATLDPVAGIANRRRFDEALSTEIQRCRRTGAGLSLIVADLDGFKGVNDRYGHGVGDEVIRAFACVLERNVRATDIPARIGGEEFAVLLPQTTLEQAIEVAQRARIALACRTIAPIEGPITASFGVAYAPGKVADGQSLLAQADRALYEAKSLGRNRVVPLTVVKGFGSGVDSL